MSPADRSRLTRRRLLRSSAALLGAAGSAGCTSTLPPLSQRTRYGRVDPPAVGAPTYRRWIPAKSALPDELSEQDLEGTGPLHVQPAELYDVAADYGAWLPIPNIILSVVGSGLDYFGDPFDRVPAVTGTGLGLVAETTRDRGAVARTLTDSGYRAAGEYRGYDLFEWPDGRRLFAVGDGRVVFSTNRSTRTSVEALIDAGRGALRRRHEADETFAALTERVGGGPFTMLSDWMILRQTDDGRPDPSATALSIRPADDGVYYVDPLYFPGGAPSVDVLRDRTRPWQLEGEMDLTEVEVDGDWATVEMFLRRDSVGSRYDRGDGPLPPLPLTTFRVYRDPGAGTLEIRHEAGGAVDADHLTVHPTSLPPEAVRVAGTGDGRFGPGDAVTIDLDALDGGERVALVLDDGDSTASLFTHDLSDDAATTPGAATDADPTATPETTTDRGTTEDR